MHACGCFVGGPLLADFIPGVHSLDTLLAQQIFNGIFRWEDELQGNNFVRGKYGGTEPTFFGSFVMGPATGYQFPMVDDVHHFSEKKKKNI